MNTPYAPDNTRSSIAIVLSLALATALIAVLVGLSNKPDVSTIGITAERSETAPSSGSSDSGESPATNDSIELDEAGDPILDDQQDAAADAASQTEQANTAGEATVEPFVDDESAPAQEATIEPTAIPDVAPAVQPTAAPSEEDTESDANDLGTAAVPSTAGTVQGSFFISADEANGAIVSQNLITISFAEDGSGNFQGVLEISYVDNTSVLLNMSGPVIWTSTIPQVENAALTGTFTLDAPIDADDISADDAELNITSLANGSGSLCTSRCFGFTFPPPAGF